MTEEEVFVLYGRYNSKEEGSPSESERSNEQGEVAI